MAGPETRNFGLVLSDGRLVYLDSAGQQEASRRFNKDKEWKRALEQGRTLEAVVRGTLVENTLEVQTIK